MTDTVRQLQSNSLIAEYDPDTQELTVTFTANGREYSHSGFPPDQWEMFAKAPSKGQFYTSRIRGLY